MLRSLLPIEFRATSKDIISTSRPRKGAEKYRIQEKFETQWGDKKGTKVKKSKTIQQVHSRWWLNRNGLQICCRLCGMLWYRLTYFKKPEATRQASNFWYMFPRRLHFHDLQLTQIHALSLCKTSLFLYFTIAPRHHFPVSRTPCPCAKTPDPCAIIAVPQPKHSIPVPENLSLVPKQYILEPKYPVKRVRQSLPPG
jgi:hypothetical protein